MKQYTLGPYLENAADNEHYAFNKGYFDAAVEVGGTDPTVWQDNEDDGFYVLNSANHEAFVFYLVDDWWFDEPTYGRDEPSVYIDDASENHFDPQFGLQLLPIHSERGWNPSSGKTVDEYMTLSLTAAKSALGLNQNWAVSGTTSDKNHGFDLLMAFTGQRSTNSYFGKAVGNSIMICGGKTGGMPYILTDPFGDNIVQHEVSHSYFAPDRDDWFEDWSIMSMPYGWQWYQNWLLADITTILEHIDIFDGV